MTLELRELSHLKMKTMSGETGLEVGKARGGVKTDSLSFKTGGITNTSFKKANMNGKYRQLQYSRFP